MKAAYRFPRGQRFELIEAEAPKPKPIGAPLRLSPIPWGQPDPALARVLRWHLADANPPIVIPFNPITHGRVRAWLHSHGIHY